MTRTRALIDDANCEVDRLAERETLAIWHAGWDRQRRTREGREAWCENVNERLAIASDARKP